MPFYIYYCTPFSWIEPHWTLILIQHDSAEAPISDKASLFRVMPYHPKVPRDSQLSRFMSLPVKRFVAPLAQMVLIYSDMFWWFQMVSDGLQEPFLLLVPADLQPGQTHFDPRFGSLLSRTFSHRTFWPFCSEYVFWFLCMSRIASYCLVPRAVQPRHRVDFLLPRLGRTIRSAIHPVDGLPGMNPKQMMPDASANMCKSIYTILSILNRSVNNLHLLRHAALWHLSCSCGHSIFSGSRCRSCARSSGGAQEASWVLRAMPVDILALISLCLYCTWNITELHFALGSVRLS